MFGKEGGWREKEQLLTEDDHSNRFSVILPVKTNANPSQIIELPIRPQHREALHLESSLIPTVETLKSRGECIDIKADS